MSAPSWFDWKKSMSRPRLAACDASPAWIWSSVSLRDALLGVKRPFVEVHLSDPSTREAFRHVNFLHDVAEASIVGQGKRGYLLALDAIAERFGG